uniref:Uncharacterized protein n=1 Tax=Arundo donax TaxID=35708 RepID=A0A0A8XUV3_ARUDO
MKSQVSDIFTIFLAAAVALPVSSFAGEETETPAQSPEGAAPGSRPPLSISRRPNPNPPPIPEIRAEREREREREREQGRAWWAMADHAALVREPPAAAPGRVRI